MYRPDAFAVDDPSTLHTYIRERSFATLAIAADKGVRLAYVPVIFDAAKSAARFHVARNNPIAMMTDGTVAHLSFLGPDAYVSPDWYVTQGMVPTWNYLAVEGRGKTRKLGCDELRRLLSDLTAAQEAQLHPKRPWTVDKVPVAKMDMLLNAIVGFEVVFDNLEGKFKLSQNVKSDDRAGVLRGLEARGDPASVTVARAMRRNR